MSNDDMNESETSTAISLEFFLNILVTLNLMQLINLVFCVSSLCVFVCVCCCCCCCCYFFFRESVVVLSVCVCLRESDSTSICKSALHSTVSHCFLGFVFFNFLFVNCLHFTGTSFFKRDDKNDDNNNYDDLSK